jgi:hypothetical protein
MASLKLALIVTLIVIGVVVLLGVVGHLMEKSGENPSAAEKGSLE